MDPRRLDQIAAAATPSPIEADVAGWWCKAAPDLPFRRASVAVPPADAAADRDRFLASLATVRRWYHRQGLRLIVQVSDALGGHQVVDGWLASEGLSIEAPVLVMTVEEPIAGDRCVEDAGRVEVTVGIDAAWAEEHGGTIAAVRTAAYSRMLAGFGPRALGATCRIDGEVAGVGFGVCDDGWLGIFGMHTSPSHRRAGVASDLVTALRLSAEDRGATGAYLQVETGNAAALALYERHDFEISHGYHYRSEPAAP